MRGEHAPGLGRWKHASGVGWVRLGKLVLGELAWLANLIGQTGIGELALGERSKYQISFETFL